MVISIGLPIYKGGSIYNCQAIVLKGKLLGLVPQNEIEDDYRRRYFSTFNGTTSMLINEEKVPFGSDLIFFVNSTPDFGFGVAIGGEYSKISHLVSRGTKMILSSAAIPETLEQDGLTINKLTTILKSNKSIIQ